MCGFSATDSQSDYAASLIASVQFKVQQRVDPESSE